MVTPRVDVGASRLLRSVCGVLAALATMAGSGCTLPVGTASDPVATPDPEVRSVSSPIAFGTLDTAHTAVVALLAPAGGNLLQECTGSLVRVTGTTGYVLTAAHCCNAHIPDTVVASSNYTVGEQYVGAGTPVPPVYRVVPGSVYYDSLYAQDSNLDHDFCMLQFSGASSSLATLALPSTNDGLSLGASIQHIGYGLTENGSNADRRAGTDAIDQQLTPLAVRFSQGGAGSIPGTCDGDSGGPSLFPASAGQSSQVIVAVQSYGSAASCAQITFGVGARVSSAMGTGGFISSYLAGTPIGVQAGVASPAPAANAWALVLLAVALLSFGRQGAARAGLQKARTSNGGMPPPASGAATRR
jgi:hypothetical protein